MSALAKRTIFLMFAHFLSFAITIGVTVAHAQNQRLEIKSEAGQTLLIVEQEYLGKKPPPNMPKLPHDPAAVDTDFYRLTYRNVSGAPLNLVRYAIGLRFGAGTLYGVKSDQGSDTFGGGLKEIDLKRQIMFDKNAFPVGYTRTYSHWVSSPRGANYMDREIAIEHDGKQLTLRWAMQYVKGDGARE